MIIILQNDIISSNIKNLTRYCSTFSSLAIINLFLEMLNFLFEMVNFNEKFKLVLHCEGGIQ